MTRSTSRDRFDAEYYQRFYGGRRPAVHGAREIARLASAVTSMLDWWRVDVRSVLDVGAGVGLWRDWFARHRPGVTYRSIEVSAYACERYGHEQRDITRWRARTRFDLVICQGVLAYLDDAGAAAAIENIASMSRGILYLEVVTRRDLAEICDRDRSDDGLRGRTGAWYRRRLEPHFVRVGAGLWCRRNAGIPFYELERC